MVAMLGVLGGIMNVGGTFTKKDILHELEDVMSREQSLRKRGTIKAKLIAQHYHALALNLIDLIVKEK
jgi:hypothetical protein